LREDEREAKRAAEPARPAPQLVASNPAPRAAAVQSADTKAKADMLIGILKAAQSQKHLTQLINSERNIANYQELPEPDQDRVSFVIDELRASLVHAPARAAR
jgi:hypothetical protein